VYASLLDEGCHHASVSTICRVLSASQGIRERGVAVSKDVAPMLRYAGLSVVGT